MPTTTLAKQPIHVADQAALVTLPTTQVLDGDIVIRDDNNNAYILLGSDPSDINNWQPITSLTNAGDLDEETALRIAADTTLQNNINSEATSRANADTTLQNNINSEASTRGSAITTLTSNLTTEASGRTAADTTLQTNITAEATARASADTTLQANIDGEVAARAAAVAGLSAGLTESASVFTTSFTATVAKIHRIDTTSGAVTVTLPNAPADRSAVLLKLVTVGTGNKVTYNTSGSDKINKTGGVTSGTFELAGQSVWLQYLASAGIWTVLANDMPLTALDGRYNGSGQNPLTGMYHFSKNGGIVASTPAGVSALADSATALQTLIDALPYGSTVFLDGYFKISLRVKWRTGISLKGIGPNQAGLVAYTVDVPPIAWGVSTDGASSGAPLTDCTFESFEIDCSNQTLTGGVYNVGAKCIAIQYMKRCHIRNLYCHDSHATAIGCDFMAGGSTITENVVINPGRSHPTTSPSAAGGGGGIGYGTANTTNEEPLVIGYNTVIGSGGATPNTSYGIFLEAQTSSQTPQTSGMRIIGNYVSGCQGGIGDCGARRTVINGNQVTANTVGIDISNGTFGGTHVSYDGIISGNNIYLNNGPGIQFDASVSGGAAKYMVTSNQIAYNFQGITFKFANTIIANRFMITNNDIHDNKYSGIRAYYIAGQSTGAALSDSDISGNFIYNNGTQGTAGDKDGLRFEVALTNVRIDRNMCFDVQTTKTQDYGLILTAAAVVTGGSIHNNDFRNCKTGGANVSGTISATTRVGSNAAYAGPAPGAVSITASPMTYTAPDFPSVLVIDGGTVSSITVAGQAVATSTNRTLLIEASEAVVITYSSAPTATSRAR